MCVQVYRVSCFVNECFALKGNIFFIIRQILVLNYIKIMSTNQSQSPCWRTLWIMYSCTWDGPRQVLRQHYVTLQSSLKSHLMKKWSKYRQSYKTLVCFYHNRSCIGRFSCCAVAASCYWWCLADCVFDTSQAQGCQTGAAINAL